MSMYLIWFLLSLFMGVFIRAMTSGEKEKSGTGFQLAKKNGQHIFQFRGFEINLTILGISVVFFLIIGMINDRTYALWIGSVLGFLQWVLLILVISIIFEQIVKGLADEHSSGYGSPPNSNSTDFESTKKYQIMIGMLTFFLIIAGVLISLGGVAAVFFIGFMLALLVPVLSSMMKSNEKESKDQAGKSKKKKSVSSILKEMGLIQEGRSLTRLPKIFTAISIFLLLIISNIMPYTGKLDFNPTFESLNETENNKDDAKVYLSGSKDVRVISWDLATQYLQRAYSDAASTLSTDQDILSQNTDPDYVNGKFVWVNAPQFEFLKWTDGKEVPFYVYVINDPENMSDEGFEAVHRSEHPLESQRGKISWEKRIDQLLHDRFAGELVTVQIRINLDDDYHPYWVVYLGNRHVLYDVVDLEKIFIIDAEDIDNTWEYDIDDPDIPDWLEVVYPDFYIMKWAKLWGSWREGITYKWFNKRHLSYPDDTPRFIILNNTSYWYLPMRQLDSKVLAGYILMNTRTGETIYHNREERSLADRSTAYIQVEKYLSSGIQGYRKLTIQEGYLYPINTTSGRVREAYIFPLYSGFTIQQYAIVDAQYYTQTPLFGTNLDSLIEEYRSHVYEAADNLTYHWKNLTFESAYADEEEGAFSSNGTTYVVKKTDLSAGNIKDSDNEWREYRLAVSDFERGENVTIMCSSKGSSVVDVDYENSDLVET